VKIDVTQCPICGEYHSGVPFRLEFAPDMRSLIAKARCPNGQGEFTVTMAFGISVEQPKRRARKLQEQEA
jgi:hypothetical protein